METQLIIGLLLTVLPVFELRGGLPIIVEYCLRNSYPIWPYFFIVILLNILVIFFVFLFFDFLHKELLRFSGYRRLIGKVLTRVQKKAEKIDSKTRGLEYFALMLLVAIPLPGTGAWTGTMIAWILGLNRLKSYVAISLGILIAGLLVLLFSWGFLFGLY
ncbi:MAG: small multi-drug export protein [archaeon]